jgi:hypothetical protein
MAVRITGSRPLPQTPLYPQDRDGAWYEHEERMRPSYISPSNYTRPAAYNAASPPLSPSAGWAAMPSPQKQQQRNSKEQDQRFPFPQSKSFSQAPLNAGSQAATSNETTRPRPSHLNSAPSRLRSAKEAYQPFGYDNDDFQRAGMAKGSAFLVSLDVELALESLDQN